jgi:hypothetical protein
MVFRYKGRKSMKGKRRRFAPKRRMARKFPKKGGLTILRKLPEIAIHNTGAGTVTQTGSVSNAVLLGAPVQSVGAAGTTSYDIPFSMRFSLNQIINHTDITNLCDKYRIAGAYVRFYYNKSGSSTLSTGSYPMIQYITDKDDANVPTISQLREKMGVKFKTFKNSSSYIGVKLRPVPAREVFNTGITSGYEVPKYAPYLDCANDTVEHYALKGVVSNFSLPATANIELIKVDVALLIQAKEFQ